MSSSIMAAIDWVTVYTQRRHGVSNDPLPDHEVCTRRSPRAIRMPPARLLVELIRLAQADIELSMIDV